MIEKSCLNQDCISHIKDISHHSGRYGHMAHQVLFILPLPPTEVNRVAAVSSTTFDTGSFGPEQAVSRIA